jgi:hypothetical protein
MVMMRCHGCGRDFRARRSDTRFCSSACRQRAYRDRQAIAKLVRLADEIEQHLSEIDIAELRNFAERFLAIIQAQQTKGRIVTRGKITKKRTNPREPA